MDPLGGSASASLVSTLQQELEHCISFHTDKIITNASAAGMEKDSENPRHKFNKELLAEIGDSRMATIRMNKAFVGSRLIFSPNVHGWLKEEDAVKVGGKVIDSGLGDCDLCAAAVCAIRRCARLSALKVEAFGTGGHAFIVINRGNSASDDNLSTWGADCLIVDVWSHNQGISNTAVMTVSEYNALFGGHLSASRLM